MKRLETGQQAPDFELPLLSGGILKLSGQRGKKIHLAFHRYASCPVCNLSLRKFTTRYHELETAGIRYLAVFHSPLEKMREYYPENPPFPLLMDPSRSVYEKYAVTPNLLGTLSLRSGLAFLQTLTTDFRKGLDPDGEFSTLPADFFIAEDGKISAVHYGEFVGDSWDVDAVLGLNRS